MPGLGLGINFSTDYFKSTTARLIASSTMLLDANRADGVTAGVNAPFTNPMVDLARNNNLTLEGFAETTADGYVDIVAPNGRIIRALKCEGVDSLGKLLNTPDLDPTGLDDAFVIKTGATLAQLSIISKNLDSFINMQYGLFTETDGRLRFFSMNNFIDVAPIGSLQINSFYLIVIKRKTQQLLVNLNRVETYNQANNINMVSAPNTRLFARSNNSGGTAHDRFFNGYFITADFTLNPSDKWESDFYRYCKQQYGL